MRTTSVSLKPRKIEEGDVVIDGWDQIDRSRPLRTVERVSPFSDQLIVTYHDDPGYVYVFKAENGLTKIGKSLNWKTRLKSLNSQSPCHLSVLFVFHSKSYTQIETLLHKLFRPFRRRGEWFDLSDESAKSIPDHVASLSLSFTQVSTNSTI